MAQYEITLILRPEGTEEQLKHTVAHAGELITKEGGVITATEAWGRRRLTFTLKKQREGVFFLLRVQGEPAAMDRLKRAFRLEEIILRVMIVRVDDAAAAATTTTGAPPQHQYERGGGSWRA